MLGRRSAALLLALLTVGCGGSSVPEGVPASVRLDVVQAPGHFAVPGAAFPHPLELNETAAEWDRVTRLLPDPLPEPVDQGSGCVAGQVVSVRLTSESSTGEVSYGPCRWPEEIEPVRLFMRTLLQRRLAAERRCDCP